MRDGKRDQWQECSSRKSKLISEGANGPITPEGHEILVKNGTVVIPDILANAGGVIVSYFEWVQDIQSFFWHEKEVNDKLKNLMVQAFHEVQSTSTSLKTDMRSAALARAMMRFGESDASSRIVPLRIVSVIYSLV